MAGDKHDHHGKKPVKGGRVQPTHHGHHRRPSGSKTKSTKANKTETEPNLKPKAPQIETPPDNGVGNVDNDADSRQEEQVFQNGEERILLARNDDSNMDDDVMSTKSADDRPTSGVSLAVEDETGRTTPYHHRYNDNFDIKSFNSSIGDFLEVFSEPRYQEVDSDYPVDDLISVVSMVSASIEEFKTYTSDSQRQLEDLRDKMRTVKENIHMSVTRQAFDIKSDEELQTVEEKELSHKLTSLNAAVAKANAEVAEAVRLSAETESTAVKAGIAADRAREEAKRIQEEIELRARMEAEKKAEEEKRKEEEERKREEEERLAEEEKRAKEAEWRKREASNLEKNPWEKWPVNEYDVGNSPSDISVECIIRGHPARFDRNDVTLDLVDLDNLDVTYGPHEELISHVVKLKSPKGDDNDLEEALYVALPHLLTRASAASREAVIKAEIDGQWRELPTREVTFENHKDLKFSQAEVKNLTTLLVMSRFKRDFVTLTKRSAKVMSSYDHRVTMVIPRDTFFGKEHFLMQVQPVDSASVHDFRLRDARAKGLLTSSPVVYMDWETNELQKPISVSLPCPPNPAKAKKLAQIRKLKEEKMKNPVRVVPVTIEEEEREKERKRLQMADGEEKKQGHNKWYMGEYGASDDDENDLLFFLSHAYGRWSVQPDVAISQAKLDLLTFAITKPYDRFMVIRTRANIVDEMAVSIATGLHDYLSKRYVQIVMKQRSEDAFDAVLHVTPVNKVDKLLTKLGDEGFGEGPTASQVLSISEGDTVEVTFRGNITSSDDRPLEVQFNSNVSSHVQFTLTEVDKYLQKNFPVYRGVVQVYRKYTVVPAEVRSITRKVSDDEAKQGPEVKRDLLCELLISIPKYHIEPCPLPVKAPITIHNTRDPVNEDYMHSLAAELGEEWRKVAHYLNVQRVRIQAILRHMQLGERSDADAKFDMLMTWLKRAPKSSDKVAILSTALIKSGREDLSDQIRTRQREYREQQIGSR
ncbi:death domain-containing protein 1-like [Haliotis rufescens]|uniref:death domain-containing protein 1-like n=1 Tax=Haliotis rufescens TaxID=6454 RepID=UPI00201E9F8F|nr:death domain-containing protein 1-like [Haliotis rufescens]XP_048251560.1 death domain-containing protein 1-like [Haliotis rufescens]